jgi:hypothetical protein
MISQYFLAIIFTSLVRMPWVKSWKTMYVSFIINICLFHLFESLRDENRPHPKNRTERKEAGLLGPTKSRLGSNSAILGLKLGRTGPTWAQLGPNFRRTRATWLQLGSNFRWLGSNMAQLGRVWTLFSACRIESAKLTRVGPKSRYVGPSPNWSCTTERLAHSMTSVAKLSRFGTCDAGGCTVVHCCHCGGQCCDVPP